VQGIFLQFYSVRVHNFTFFLRFYNFQASLNLRANACSCSQKNSASNLSKDVLGYTLSDSWSPLGDFFSRRHPVTLLIGVVVFGDSSSNSGLSSKSKIKRSRTTTNGRIESFVFFVDSKVVFLSPPYEAGKKRSRKKFESICFSFFARKKS
jgi:hypothetical protein